jgi:hypothetical protein
LETSLDKLNNGQGLGFVVGGVVINNQTLAMLLLKIGGAAFTIMTYLLAYANDDLPAPGGNRSAIHSP